MKEAKGLQKYFGFMFRTSSTEPIFWHFEEDTDLMFHTFFVFFPVMMRWIDKDYNIIEERLVYPWEHSIRPKSKFRIIEEYPYKQYKELFVK